MANQDQKLTKYRESMYRFFASIYIDEVDRDTLEKLRKLKLPKIAKPSLGWQIDFNAGYELFEDYLKSFDGKSREEINEQLEDLAADYAKIFLAAGQASGKAAFPYESVYVGTDSEFGGSLQANLKALYAAKGLKVREDMFKIMEDHIGLEFNYMAELLKEQAQAQADGDKEKAAESMKEQTAFFKDHLLNWTQSFTNDIYKYADRGFYRGIARMTSGFLGFEEAVLKDKELRQ